MVRQTNKIIPFGFIKFLLRKAVFWIYQTGIYNNMIPLIRQALRRLEINLRFPVMEKKKDP
jgi:hypothetical protein